MRTNCDLILRWGATPDQLAALGTTLWGWCTRETGPAGIYQHLDNQALADLLAGQHPGPGQTSWGDDGRRCSHFHFRGQPGDDRQATIASLRRDLPPGGVEDIVIDGKSWDLID
jgi:hypothetical protein